MASGVLLIQRATPETIVQFHDQLSNELPTLKGKWGFNFKIFRNNVYSIPPELEESATVTPENKYLYTLAPSYLGEATIALLNRRSTGVFTSAINGEGATSGDLTIPNDHLHFGATTGLNDPFDYFIAQKLQSLWTQRQLIKGDGGQIYELENGNLTIRTSNVFLHGNFRGLLIEIELAVVDPEVPLTSAFQTVREKYSIPEGKLCCEVLDRSNLDRYGDLCLQYSEILNF